MNTYQGNLVSRSTFNLYLCVLVCLTFGVFFTVGFSVDPLLLSNIGTIGLVAITLIGVFLSCAMCQMKGNTPIQLIGLMMLPIIMGVISSPWLATANTDILYEAALTTGMAASIMFMLSVTFPDFFMKIRGILFGALIALVLVGIASIFFFDMNMTVYHLCSLVIFLGFLGYDFVLARNTEPTLSNAIILSSSLFIDLLNIFRSIYGLIED